MDLFKKHRVYFLFMLAHLNMSLLFVCQVSEINRSDVLNCVMYVFYCKFQFRYLAAYSYCIYVLTYLSYNWPILS